jgi:hypothetical protein
VRIAKEQEDVQQVLKEQILWAFFEEYQDICRQLKEVLPELGQNYETFLAEHGIEFPPLEGTPQMTIRRAVDANLRE